MENRGTGRMMAVIYSRREEEESGSSLAVGTDRVELERSRRPGVIVSGHPSGRVQKWKVELTLSHFGCQGFILSFNQ